MLVVVVGIIVTAGRCRETSTRRRTATRSVTATRTPPVAATLTTSPSTLSTEPDSESYSPPVPVSLIKCPTLFSAKTPLAGGWTDWSSWSSCGVDCSRSRSRDCSDPAPFAGGAECEGNNTLTEPCCAGDCQGLSCPALTFPLSHLTSPFQTSHSMSAATRRTE